MKLPAFQFYPGDWRSNAKLRRCSEAARGAWIDIMCLLHDSDEYGIVRWPLDDLIRAAGVSSKSTQELVRKSVLKGSDQGIEDFIYTPSHAGIDGENVILIASTSSPCWYCSRFVIDSWRRSARGGSTRFKKQPTGQPTHAVGERVGDESGDGSSSSSSSSSSKYKEVDRSAEIYQAYPKHQNHKATIPKIARAVKKYGFDFILGKVQDYAKAKAGTDIQYIPAPDVWFNKEKYNDDPKTWQNGHTQTEEKSIYGDRLL